MSVPFFFGGGGQANPYQVANSLRGRAGGSTSLGRTMVAGSRQKWTFRALKRRTLFGVNEPLLGCYYTSNVTQIYFQTNETLRVVDTVAGFDYQTTMMFRDNTSYYDICVSVDTTQATAANRVIIQVNGKVITSFSTATAPAQNANCVFGYAGGSIGVGQVWTTSGTALAYADGNFADVNIVDGAAVLASSFGLADPSNPTNWIPRAPVVADYGANGARLEFKNSGALGTDTSGKGNTFGVTNFTASDQSNDSPTNIYPIMNALAFWTPSIPSQYAYPSQGGLFLQASNGTSYYCGYKTTMPITGTTGKFYFEVTWVSGGGSGGGSSFYLLNADTGVALTGNTFDTPGTVVGYAIDCAAGTVAWYKNGVSQGTLYSFTPGTPLLPTFNVGNGPSLSANFGQTAFTYTPPTNFKPLCTANLPAVSIKRPNRYLDVNTRSGTGAAFSVTGMGFQPDLVWSKSRSAATDHLLFDSVRGATKRLSSNSTAAEVTDATSLTSFNSDGFSGGALAALNTSGATYVDWLWRRGAAQGVDVVTWIGNGLTTQAIPHALGVAPKFVICKRRDTIQDWNVWHKSLTGDAYYLILDSTAAQNSAGTVFTAGGWGASSITVGGAYTNTGSTFVAYLFAEVPGFSKFGSYTGNGGGDGPCVFTGFRPRWIMVKRTDSTGDWTIIDALRSPANVCMAALFPDLSAAESSAGPQMDILANGFKLRSPGGDINVSSASYIYAAFADAPFGGSNISPACAR